VHTETGRLPLSFPVSECLALNPVGRTTYCIRLPGGPATCGVPRRELRFAPFRKSVLFVSLPFLLGGDGRIFVGSGLPGDAGYGSFCSAVRMAEGEWPPGVLDDSTAH